MDYDKILNKLTYEFNNTLHLPKIQKEDLYFFDGMFHGLASFVEFEKLDSFLEKYHEMRKQLMSEYEKEISK